MRMPCKRIRAALLCVLCAAALMFPARMAENVAYASEAVTAEAESMADNDALFYGYLLRRAGVSNDASLLADAGSKLSEKDRELYDKLKEFVSKIASGEQTETVLTITFDDFPLTWTAAELGVSDIFSAQGKAALSAKVDELYNYDTDAVFDALLSDCPYELYWYNKSRASGGGVTFHYAGYSYFGNASQVTLSSAPTMTITMSVSWNYGRGATVNRALREGIEKVVSNATAIVSQYGASSDYEKLLGYAKEICDRVEYDDVAAKNSNTPYCDPWQLISVFDDDASTNVVCEGYSKAFKYLCDLSVFSNSNVECYLVTGKLYNDNDEDDPGEGHMWNLVTMDNEKRYLVDVTNSDSNGGPDYLFLKGGTPHSANPSQYTFHDWLTFVYDDNSRKLWGDEFLTLDAADYQPSSSAPASEYEYELRNVAASGGGVTVEVANLSGDGATLIVAAYAENGQLIRAAMDNAKTVAILKGTSDNVTLELDTEGAKTVRAFLLDDTQKPLCPAFPYSVG